MNTTNATREEMTQTFSIPEANLSGLEAAIGRLARKAAKLGAEPVTITVGEPVDTEDAEKPGVFHRHYPVTVSGSTPRLNGWGFRALLERVEDEVLITKVPGGDELPRRFRDVKTCGDCDHCRVYRRRHSTYVLHHAETGDYKQVGSSCLADFLGYNDNPLFVAQCAEMIWEAMSLGEAAEEGGGMGGGPSDYLGALAYLGHVAAAVRVAGWVSRSQARASI